MTFSRRWRPWACLVVTPDTLRECGIYQTSCAGEPDKRFHVAARDVTRQLILPNALVTASGRPTFRFLNRGASYVIPTRHAAPQPPYFLLRYRNDYVTISRAPIPPRLGGYMVRAGCASITRALAPRPFTLAASRWQDHRETSATHHPSLVTHHHAFLIAT